MSVRERIVKHRHKIVPLVVLLALGIAGVRYREELVAWFSGKVVSTERQTAMQSVKAGAFDVSVGFSPDPPREKGNTLLLKLKDADAAVVGAKVEVRYRMPPMGSMQEMRGEAEVEEEGDGRYAARFDLPMGGSWELTIDVSKAAKAGTAMFSMTVGTPGLTSSEQASTKNAPPEEGLDALPAHAFDDATLERLRAAFAAYEQLRALLAHDKKEGLREQATAVGASLQAAANDASDLPASVREAIDRGKKAAEALAKAGDAPSARKPFGELSRALVGLTQVDPRLASGLHLFKCPMAEGYPKWFQPSPRLENPYMGQEMPECGVRSKWDAPVASASSHEHGGAAGGDDEIAYYTCSMHPSVKQSGPGKCPICAMDLTPVTKQEAETGTLFVDEIRRQRIGVRIGKVQDRKLTLKVRAVGAVRFDETRLRDVNLRMSGWVSHLGVDETGQRVKAGQTLFTLYSPELYAAELEHLTGLERQKDDGGEMLSHLARASRQRLRLLGMSEAQIAALEKRGQAQENVPIPAPASGYVIEKNVVAGARVEAGMRVYRIADLSKVWIDAEIYEADLPQVRVDQPVEVELPYVAGARYAGKVDYVYPTLEGKTRTGRARIVLENEKLELKPDMYANVNIAVDLGERLTIPESAVVYTGPRRLVFLDLGEGKLQPKAVKLGVHAEGYYEVTDGLSEGDEVVVSGNFLIAAESRIRSAAQYWEGANDSK